MGKPQQDGRKKQCDLKKEKEGRNYQNQTIWLSKIIGKSPQAHNLKLLYCATFKNYLQTKIYNKGFCF